MPTRDSAQETRLVCCDPPVLRRLSSEADRQRSIGEWRRYISQLEAFAERDETLDEVIRGARARLKWVRNQSLVASQPRRR
jgi:hypothetical protein